MDHPNFTWRNFAPDRVFNQDLQNHLSLALQGLRAESDEQELLWAPNWPRPLCARCKALNQDREFVKNGIIAMPEV